MITFRSHRRSLQIADVRCSILSKLSLRVAFSISSCKNTSRKIKIKENKIQDYYVDGFIWKFKGRYFGIPLSIHTTAGTCKQYQERITKCLNKPSNILSIDRTLIPLVIQVTLNFISRRVYYTNPTFQICFLHQVSQPSISFLNNPFFTNFSQKISLCDLMISFPAEMWQCWWL